MNETENALTIDELLRGIWRRKGMALALAASVMALGVAYWLTVRPTYTATSVIRVADQELPVQLLRRTVTDTPETRLTTARQELLATPVLQKVIEELGLYPDAIKKGDVASAVDVLRQHLDVKVEGERAITLTVTAGSARTAADIANRLPQVYADMVLADRAAQARRASEVFDDEIAQLRPQIERVEHDLASFKSQNANTLPESLDGNMRQLDRLTTLTNSTVNNLADAQRRHTALAHQGLEVNLDLERWNTAVSDARRAMAQLKATYTEDSPEVIAARHNYEDVQKRFEAAAAAAKEGDTEDGRVRTEMSVLAGTIKSYQDQMGEIEKRIMATPEVGARLAALDRDYQSLTARFNDVLTRKVEADLNRDLESRQHASLFQMIDPAIEPSAPTAPNVVTVLGLSFLLALLLSFGVTGMQAARDTSFRDVAEARRRLGLPVLATVPDLDRAARKAG